VRYRRGVLRIEFTIEPFVPGQPGPHVTLAIRAVEALGVEVEFGPFSSSCVVPEVAAGTVASTILQTAFTNGASRVTMHTDALDSGGAVTAGGSGPMDFGGDAA
jgi:hypothetical protein